MRTILYKYPSLYKLSMKILYGKEYFKRFEKIAEFIEPDSNVLDLCAGDCSVYEYALRKKNVSYTAVDISPEFINYAKKLGVKTIIQDVRTFDIPKTDVILLLDSIYQFPEKFSEILEQAKKKSKLLIVLEPVENMANSSSRFIRFISSRLTDFGEGELTFRFTKNSLIKIWKDLNVSEIIELNRDILGLWKF